jgi:hypothetical protein
LDLNLNQLSNLLQRFPLSLHTIPLSGIYISVSISKTQGPRIPQFIHWLGYRPENLGFESLHNTQKSSRTNPGSYSVCTRNSCTREKQLSTKLNTHLYLLLSLGLSVVISLLSIYAFMICTGAPSTLLPPLHTTYPFHSFIFVHSSQQH